MVAAFPRLLVRLRGTEPHVLHLPLTEWFETRLRSSKWCASSPLDVKPVGPRMIAGKCAMSVMLLKIDCSLHLTKNFRCTQLNWYKLANEAAMKAALIKQQRFKDVPRYNPAAERVRQRATWIEQVRFCMSGVYC
jgi:hypothetical protein